MALRWCTQFMAHICKKFIHAVVLAVVPKPVFKSSYILINFDPSLEEKVFGKNSYFASFYG